MQAKWLTQKGKRSCMVFFAGWGMDPAPFRPVVPDAMDLLMFYDYRMMDLPQLDDLARDYRDLHLLAWSMGVWVAGSLLGESRELFTTRTAVNGTLKPVDDRFGIPEKAFADMIDSFSEASLDAFYTSMFDDREGTDTFMQNRPDRPLEEMRDELIALRYACLENGPATDIFTRKLVGSRDRIFTARSQLRSWGKNEATVLPMTHFPFYGPYGLDNLARN